MYKASAISVSSPAQPLRLLIVSDDPKDVRAYLSVLEKSGIVFQADTASTQEDFVRKLRERPVDVVLSDYRMNGGTSIGVLSLVNEMAPGVPLIIVNGTLSDKLAVECVQQGVTDCVSRDQLTRLPMAVRRAQRENALREAEGRALEALRESEARYRGLVDNATWGIYGVMLDGEILHANLALARMLGHESPGEVLAVGNAKLFYCDPRAHDEVFAKCQRNGRADSVVHWKRKDGKPITVRVIGWRAREPERGTEYIEAIVEDVTERRGLEKQFMQAQKFESIGQLAGGIAHDFSNLIGAIVGWADLGVEETQPGSRLRRHFEKVRHQAERAAALTQQLLAFARPQVLEPRDIDLNQAVIETLSLLEKVIGVNIRITADLSPYLAVVRADPVQIEQVLMNLCVNARDAMPAGGALTVATSNIVFDEESSAALPLASPGKYAMLSVADTGTGIDAATLAHIFEPFFTTKEVGKGTGLGLSTVFGIVRQHGGFVHVDSEPGIGTTFRTYFPASTTADIRLRRSGDTQAIPGGSETILLAENHEGLRRLAYETLRNLGYQVVVAADGERAVEKFQAHQHPIDLAVLDEALPKLSGFEVYARISSDRPGLAAILATAENLDIASPHQVPPAGFLVLRKPYTPRELGLKVRQALDEHARLAPQDLQGAEK